MRLFSLLTWSRSGIPHSRLASEEKERYYGLSWNLPLHVFSRRPQGFKSMASGFFLYPGANGVEFTLITVVQLTIVAAVQLMFAAICFQPLKSENYWCLAGGYDPQSNLRRKWQIWCFLSFVDLQQTQHFPFILLALFKKRLTSHLVRAAGHVILMKTRLLMGNLRVGMFCAL